MRRCVDVHNELTVTVAANGDVTWSPLRLDARAVHRDLLDAIGRCRHRETELMDCLDALVRVTEWGKNGD